MDFIYLNGIMNVKGFICKNFKRQTRSNLLSSVRVISSSSTISFPSFFSFVFKKKKNPNVKIVSHDLFAVAIAVLLVGKPQFVCQISTDHWLFRSLLYHPSTGLSAMLQDSESMLWSVSIVALSTRRYSRHFG